MAKEQKFVGFRDIILIAVLAAVSIVIQIVAGLPFLATPQLMMFVAVAIIFIITGPIYVLLMNKAAKPGAAFLYVAVLAVYFLLIGQPLIAVVFLVGAVATELSLIGGGYQSPLRIGISFMIYGAFYVVGSYLPYVIFADRYIDQMLSGGFPQETIDLMMNVFANPLVIFLAMLNACLWAAVGAYLGYRMRRKHFTPAGVA